MAQTSRIRFQARWLSEQYCCLAYGLLRADLSREQQHVIGPGKFLEIEEPQSPLTASEVEAIVARERTQGIGLFIFCKHGFTRQAAECAGELDAVLVRSAGESRVWDVLPGSECGEVPVRPGRSLQMTTINPEGARA